MSFKDHFSSNSDNYSTYRPHYPSQLFADLATMCKSHDKVWDVGTGSGQAALAWTEHFNQVFATDASESQIAHAKPHPNITYAVAPAEQCPLADQSVDLVSIAQALHWFDFDKFYREVQRVLKPQGIIAAWTYTRPESNIPAIAEALEHFYFKTVGPFWPKERDWVDDHYKTIPFPFELLATSNYRIEFQWTVNDLLGYLDTWSASKAFEKETGKKAVDVLRPIITPLIQQYTADGQTLEITWPIYVKAGKWP